MDVVQQIKNFNLITNHLLSVAHALLSIDTDIAIDAADNAESSNRQTASNGELAGQSSMIFDVNQNPKENVGAGNGSSSRACARYSRTSTGKTS